MDRTFLVYVTARDEAEAAALGRLLVERRLAACVNVIPRIASFYWWEGELVEDREAVLIAKTAERLLEPLAEAVRGAHSYQVPAILAFPVEHLNPAYRDWLLGELRPLG